MFGSVNLTWANMVDLAWGLQGYIVRSIKSTKRYRVPVSAWGEKMLKYNKEKVCEVQAKQAELILNKLAIQHVQANDMIGYTYNMLNGTHDEKIIAIVREHQKGIEATIIALVLEVFA